MTAAQLSQYSAVVIPAMTNVQNDAQAQQITGVLSALKSEYGVGIITSGNFMTADANNALLTAPYLAMQTLLGTTFSQSGTGSYSVSVDPRDRNQPDHVFLRPRPVDRRRQRPVRGDDDGLLFQHRLQVVHRPHRLEFHHPRRYQCHDQSGTGLGHDAIASRRRADDYNGGINTVFATPGLFGDSNLLQHAVQNAVFGSDPADARHDPHGRHGRFAHRPGPVAVPVGHQARGRRDRHLRRDDTDHPAMGAAVQFRRLLLRKHRQQRQRAQR